MPGLAERVDTLESVLGQFIVHTDVALRRLEDEMRAFKEEMRAFREESEKDRKALHNEMQAFKDEMRAFREESEKDRKALHDEMRAFKDEMRAFKDEMREEHKKRNREWSNLAKKMGTLVEDLIAPALRPTLSKYFGCELTMEGQRILRRREGKDYEVDALALCNDMVFMVEVRATPRQDDIKEILEKGKSFFEFFPEQEGKRLVIIFGSITFPDDVIRQASKKGIYVMGWREWEYMDILNFEEVKKLHSKL
ncbi:MAG: hypothetical protein ACK4TF_01335 [Thermodesulfovibrionales bacterium]